MFLHHVFFYIFHFSIMLLHVGSCIKAFIFFFYLYYFFHFISFFFITCLFDVCKFFQFCFHFKYEGCIFSTTILVEVSFNRYFFCIVSLHFCVVCYSTSCLIPFPMCFCMCCFVYQTLTFLHFCFISSHSLLSLCLSLNLCLFYVCRFFHDFVFVLKILVFNF